MDAKQKLEKLRGDIRSMGSVLVAFSGGVDSTFLLKVAHDTLGEKAVAVTALTESFPRVELEESKKLAAEIGARQVFVETNEMENEDYRRNDYDRCYFCKSELFGNLESIAKREGLNMVLFGEVADDRHDHRPGAKAAKERNVRAPLAAAGLNKIEIRELSKEMGLPTWDKPSFACLASRIPFGSEVTREKLAQVERGEELLRAMGFRQFRVRHHGEIARIELDGDGLGRAAEKENRTRIVEHFRSIGFRFVTLDLAGYRTGSFNPGKTS